MRNLVLVLLLIPFSCFAEIYKWTDENGNIHFGDSPKEETKAEKVVVGVNSYEHVSYDNVEAYQGAGSKKGNHVRNQLVRLLQKGQELFPAKRHFLY